MSNTWDQTLPYCSFNPRKNCMARSSCFRWAIVVRTEQVHLIVQEQMGSGLKFSISSHMMRSFMKYSVTERVPCFIDDASCWRSEIPLRVSRLQITLDFFYFVHSYNTLSNWNGYRMNDPRHHHVIAAAPCSIRSISLQWFWCISVYKFHFIFSTQCCYHGPAPRMVVAGIQSWRDECHSWVFTWMKIHITFHVWLYLVHDE